MNDVDVAFTSKAWFDASGFSNPKCPGYFSARAE